MNTNVKEAKQLAEVETKDLLTIPEGAIAALAKSHNQLAQFVAGQLKRGTDFGRFGAASKDSLLKPGAEKLARIFCLGSKIVHSDKIIDLDKKYVEFTYRVEIFRLKTGQTLSQCEGSANNQEKKYARTAIPDLINTLRKMAQKRAYVGAVISAIGASDFFTQDMEDIHDASFKRAPSPQPRNWPPRPAQEQANHFSPQSEAPAFENRPASPKQIGAIMGMGKARGLDELGVMAHLVEKFGKEQMTNEEGALSKSCLTHDMVQEVFSDWGGN